MQNYALFMQNYALLMSRLGCQTQRFRRPVGLLGFQSNNPLLHIRTCQTFVYGLIIRILKRPSERFSDGLCFTVYQRFCKITEPME